MIHSRNQAGPHRPILAEPIRSGEVWPIRLLHNRLGWGARTLANAIRQGLRVHRWGKLAYVHTDDLIGFLTKRNAIAIDGTGKNQEGRANA